MRVLVIGGSCFLGKELIYTLVKNNIRVTSISRSKIIDYTDGVDYRRLDRRNIDEIEKVFENDKYDIIIDLACFDEEDVRILDNVLRRPTKYIVISSNIVYDSTTYSHEVEIDELIPFYKNKTDGAFNEYRLGKARAEKAIIDSKKLDYIILRPPCFVGEHYEKCMLDTFYENIKNEQACYFGNMDSTICFIHVDDLINSILFAINKDLKGIYNVNSSGNITVKEIIKTCEKTLNKKRIEHEWDDKYSIVEQNMDNSKAIGEGMLFKNINCIVEDYFRYKKIALSDK